MLPICKGDASEDESPQPDVRNDSDSSYLGDVESLSCDSAEPSSDSEGHLSEMFSKGNIRKHLLKLFICCPKLVWDSLSMELVFRVPIVSRIPDSLSSVRDTRAQGF